MSMSGIDIDEDAVKTFERLKITSNVRKEDPEWKGGLLMQLYIGKKDGKDRVLMKEKLVRRQPLNRWMEKLTEESFCSWLIFDLDDKIHVLPWVPDGANLKDKMVFASTSVYVKSRFPGTTKEECANVNGADDLDAFLKKHQASLEP